MTPLTHSAKKIDQEDSKNKDMFKKKYISIKVLTVKVAHNDHLDSSSQKINQVDSSIKDMG